VKNLDKRTCLAAAIAAVSVAGTCVAPSALADGLSIIPGVGYYSFDNDLNLDDVAAPTIGLQYLFGDKIAVEANYSKSSVDDDNGIVSNNIDWKYTRLDAFYNFTGLSDRMIPYVVAGAGEAVSELTSGGSKADETMLNAGGGLRVLFDKGFSMVADLRAVNSIDNEKTSGLASLGVSYTMGIGGSRSSEGDFEISMNDSASDADGDGIADKNDQCANTPSGVAVNDVGCGLDGDSDGVADYQDECAQTPAGVSVDSLGCPSDLDKDGIADYQDQCPESAIGSLTDATGCELQVSKNIQFKLNSAELPSNELGEVEELATFLKRYKDTVAVIEGHSDASGDKAYNEKLSALRAAQVKQILINQFGIAPSRLTTESYGESRPVASNDTRKGREANRRVTATITNK
jgi:OOP family OmpA-OmpF porin